MIAAAMQDVFHDVEVEPQLLPIQNEDVGENGKLCKRGKIGHPHKRLLDETAGCFFDIRITHTKANLLSSPQAMSQLGVHEREKKGNMQNVWTSLTVGPSHH